MKYKLFFSALFLLQKTVMAMDSGEKNDTDIEIIFNNNTLASVEFLPTQETRKNYSHPYIEFIESHWMSWTNNYHLGIIMPITLGVVVASLFLGLLCICCWIRRLCSKRHRRRLIVHRAPQKIRQEIDQLKQVDRVKLLAETSDEEF